MSAQKKNRLGFSILLAILLLAVLALGFWWKNQDRVPSPIRIAPSASAGLGLDIVCSLVHQLQLRGYPTELKRSPGSFQNQRWLRQGSLELAVVKASSLEGSGEQVVAPLFLEIVVFIVRRSAGIHHIRDLAGRRILVGASGSGTHELARRILERYQLKPGDYQELEQRFDDIALPGSTVEAAVVSTAINNPELTRLLANGQFEILPIEDATALTILHPFLTEVRIPRALYSETPPIPATELTTLATWSLLVCRQDASPRMVEATLDALYDANLLMRFPLLHPRSEAARWSFPPMHPAARSFHDPYQGLGVAANMLESLSALKELTLALLALVWLGWQRYQSAREQARKLEFLEQKERLDAFVVETIELEKQLLEHLKDAPVLERLFVQVTRLKLEALSEMTHEELRTDRGFTVLMTQCRDLSEKIQRCQQALGNPDEVAGGLAETQP